MNEWVWTKDADGDLAYMRERPTGVILDLTDDLIIKNIPKGIYLYNGAFTSAWMLEIWGDYPVADGDMEVTLRQYISADGAGSRSINITKKCSLENVVRALHKVDFNQPLSDLSLQSFDFDMFPNVSHIGLRNDTDIMISFDSNEDYMTAVLSI